MSEIVDMITFNEAKAVMKHKFATILQYFLEDAADYINTIKAGIHAADNNSIRSAAHTLKSSSQQIGAIKLSAISAQIEEAARTGVDHESIAEMLPKIDMVLSETTAALRNI